MPNKKNKNKLKTNPYKVIKYHDSDYDYSTINIKRLRDINNDTIQRQLSKLIIPSSDTGTWDKDNPGVKPIMAQYMPTITKFEELTVTVPILYKGINIIANRLLGEGFTLQKNDKSDEVHLAELCKDTIEKFYDKININSFLLQSIKNALISGNEWTELVYSDIGHFVTNLNHGDYKTIDFQRDYVNNKVLLDEEGDPVGYWQEIEDISELHRLIGIPEGTKANREHAIERYNQSKAQTIEGEYGKGILTGKANYMLIEKDEIVHLAFDTFNDNFYGMSRILPCYDAVIQLQNVLNSTAEMVYRQGFKKMTGVSGDKDTPASEEMVQQLENVIKDAHYKDGFVLTYPNRIEMLEDNGSLQNVYQIPDNYLMLISFGLRVPKEILISGGDVNRATANQESSDFEKDIETMRVKIIEYLNKINKKILLNSIRFSDIPNWKNKVDRYIPVINFEPLIKEDEALRRERIYKEWQLGFLTWGEAREMLGYDVVEEDPTISERSNKYYIEVTQPTNQQVGTEVNPSMQQAISRNEGQQFSETRHRHFRLEPKSKTNPRLNKEYKTKDVDYKQIVQDNVGQEITTVPKYKLNKVRDELVNGIVNKKNPKKVLKEMVEKGNLTEGEALRIATTEIKRIKETGKYEQAKENKARWKKWNAIIDDRTSNISKALNGQVRRIDEKFKISYVDESGKRKSWQGLYPPEQPNTRDYVEYYDKHPSRGGKKVL